MGSGINFVRKSITDRPSPSNRYFKPHSNPGRGAATAQKSRCAPLRSSYTVHVDTDRLFHELFRTRPEWLRELTGLPLPYGCRGSSPTLKQLEVRCDLLIEPDDPDEPEQIRYLFEFQLYHDHSVFHRIELARQILLRQLNPRDECRRRDYRPRAAVSVVLFGSRNELPSSCENHPQVRVLFLDELLADLRRRDPDSPLGAALAPLGESIEELEKGATEHYDTLRKAVDLDTESREVLEEVFVNLLMQRFKTRTWAEIRTMITELTPLEETRAGQDLIEKGIERGRARGELDLVVRLLERKFPAAAPRARPLVETLDEAGLLAFGEALLFFDSEEDCLAWLERGQSR